MEEKIMIKIDDLLQQIKSNFEETCDAVNESGGSAKDNVVDFFEKVTSSIVSFFYFDHAGDAIKSLYEKAETCNPSVKCMDFAYAVFQYGEYLKGMNKYINNAPLTELPEEMVNSISDIMLKDEDFIQSLFDYGNNKNNQEKELPLSVALSKTANILFEVKDIVIGFHNDRLTGTVCDKLVLLSKVRFAYYAVTGIFKQLERIVNEVYNPSEPEPEKPMYAVF